jgi:hypothetical protein
MNVDKGLLRNPLHCLHTKPRIANTNILHEECYPEGSNAMWLAEGHNASKEGIASIPWFDEQAKQKAGVLQNTRIVLPKRQTALTGIDRATLHKAVLFLIIDVRISNPTISHSIASLRIKPLINQYRMHTDCDDLVGLTSPWTAARDGRACRELRDKVYVPENWNRYTGEFRKVSSALPYKQIQSCLVQAIKRPIYIRYIMGSYLEICTGYSKRSCRALLQFLMVNRGITPW